MASSDKFTFGPYQLFATERLLLKGAEAVNVGSRALDVLIALVEGAGEVVSQRDLMARAWPNTVVGKGSLRVAIAELRKALHDDEDGARYITNVTGRGYSFVERVIRAPVLPEETLRFPPGPAPTSEHELPPCSENLIGRADAIEALSAMIASRRFVSVVGAGGLGKTTIAVSVGHALLSAFGGAIYFVDLGAIADPRLVPSTVAAVLGSFAQENDPLSSLLAFLTDRRILLILDNCEHVIDATTLLLERLYRHAPQVHILTTSREALRAKGEYVHLLMPLEYPTAERDMTADETLSYPAVQLFMERAFASGYAADLSDGDAPTVAAICRRLDGVALAIELAGSRVGSYGIQGTAHLLSNRFKLLWQGRRSALPRHQTLHAMIDWSFNLLSDRERRVLACLSIFVGPFTLEAAQAIASDDQTDVVTVAAAVTSLVDKSLVWIALIDGIAHHRLLDSTMAFAAEKLVLITEASNVARQHALYFAQWCSIGASIGHVSAEGVPASTIGPHMGNVRAALEWCFTGAGDTMVGVRLAAAAAPLFVELSLLVECRRWCEQALASLPDDHSDAATQLTLQEALAVSTMFSHGNSENVRSAIERGVKLACTLGDMPRQLNLIAGLNIFLTRVGDFRGAMAVAQRSVAIAQKIGTSAATATAEWMLGVAYHLVGDQANAQWHCERGMITAAATPPSQVTYFGYDHRVRGLVALARILWIRGFPDRAAKTAALALDEAVKRHQPVDCCIALIYTATVSLWRGDLTEAEHRIERLAALSSRYSLGPYRAAGLALSGELSIARGQAEEGVILLRQALSLLRTERHHILTSAFHRALAEGLLRTDEHDEAATMLDAAIAGNNDNDDSSNAPELLRIRGEVCLRADPPDPKSAERYFQLSLQQARSQSALSFELRSGLALAQLWSSEGRDSEAIHMLWSVCGQFEEGHGSRELVVAEEMLADLRQRMASFHAVGKWEIIDAPDGV
jgi:predicted ATPase/DNA-binding winged helix-turn-helix (wHTH) protein